MALQSAQGALRAAHGLQERARRRRIAAAHLEGGAIADEVQALGIDAMSAAAALRHSARDLDVQAAAARARAAAFGIAAGCPFHDDELDPVPF